MSDEPVPEVSIQDFLKTDSVLVTLCAGRIFANELPEAQTASMPRKCIVVEPGGGSQTFGNGYQEYSDARYDLKCYGETPYEAGLVGKAASRALKQLRREVHARLLLHWSRRAGGPLSLRDPDTKWPYQFSSFQVLASESEVEVSP